MAGPNGNPGKDNPANQTIGYEALKADAIKGEKPDVTKPDAAKPPIASAEASTPPTPPQTVQTNITATPAQHANDQGASIHRSGMFGSLHRGAASIFGKSIMTTGGQRVPTQALVGPYEIIDELGTGGMGVVYKARHVNINRIVALKMISGGFVVTQGHLERFRLEAEAIGKLNHPNIVQVYDVGESEQGLPYIALELVDGGNLHKKCDGKPQSPKYAAQMVETLCRAVHAAHQSGVIHRDLKPHNVLLTLDGQPKVTDFGLAKDLGGGGNGQTHAGSIIGTPSYMSPEQAAGRVKDIGVTTDIYALGCILYELLTGHPPFRGESPIATIRMVMDGEVVAPRTIVAGVPRDLDTICLKALQKPPHRRYQTAVDFAEDLRRFLDNEPIKARPIGNVERTVKWVRRNPTKASLTATGVLFAAVLVGLGVWSYVAITKQMELTSVALLEAKKQKEESDQRLVSLNIANGSRELDTYNYLNAPLWYAEALFRENRDDERKIMHRRRLRAVFDHLPRVSQIWHHDNSITDACFDISGKMVMSADDKGGAMVWSTATSGETAGKMIGSPLDHTTTIHAIAISPDGQFAATGGSDSKIRLWKIGDRDDTRITFDTTAAITQVLFATKTKRLIAASGSNLLVWDIDQPSKPKYSIVFSERINRIVLSKDERFVAACSNDSTARILVFDTGLEHMPPLKHKGQVTDCTFTRDGKKLITAYTLAQSRQGTAVVWNVDNGQEISTQPMVHLNGSIRVLAVSPDDRHIITASNDSSAKVWDLVSGQPVGQPVNHKGPVTHLSISPDGRWFATASDDNTVRVWDILTGDPVAPPMPHNALPTALHFSPNGYELLVADQTQAVRVWNLITNGERTGTLTRNAKIPQSAIPNKNEAQQSAISPNGKYLISYPANQAAVGLRRLTDNSATNTRFKNPTSAAITTAVFSPDSKMIVTGDQEGGVYGWTINDTADALPTTTAAWLNADKQKHVSKVLRIVFSDDGSRIATTSEDSTARVWRASDGKSLISPIKLGSGCYNLQFSSDGKMLYTELATGNSRVWDASTGETLTPPFPPRKDWESSMKIAEMSVEEMRAAGRMLCGQQLSDEGAVLPYEAKEMRADWLQLKEKYDFVSNTKPDELINWRKQQAKACEDSERWFAAGWHLDQLIAAEKDNADYYRRRGTASANLQDWKRAADDAAKALRLRPYVIANWQQRGVALGQLGDWNKSPQYSAKGTELYQNPERAIGLHPIVLLEGTPDIDGYRRACQELVEKYKDQSPSQRIAHQLAWAWAIMPDSGVEDKWMIKMVGFLDRQELSSLIVRTMVAVRTKDRIDRTAADLMEAIKRETANRDQLSKEAANVKDPLALASLVYAIARVKSTSPGLPEYEKYLEEARGHRKAVDEWLNQQVKQNTSWCDWDTRVAVEILLREANSLMK